MSDLMSQEAATCNLRVTRELTLCKGVFATLQWSRQSDLVLLVRRPKPLRQNIQVEINTSDSLSIFAHPGFERALNVLRAVHVAEHSLELARTKSGTFVSSQYLTKRARRKVTPQK